MGKVNWKDNRTLTNLVGEDVERKRPVPKSKPAKKKRK